MRRKRISTTWPLNWRRGVIASVSSSMRSAHSPSPCSIAATGSGPSASMSDPLHTCQTRQDSSAKGVSAKAWMAALASTSGRETCAMGIDAFNRIPDGADCHSGRSSLRRLSSERSEESGSHDASIPPLQIHPRIQRRHLVAIAVEHPRRDAIGEQPVAGACDATLGLLAPAWMVDARIDVAVEAVLAGLQPVPCGRRHALGEADLDDRLDALEPVLP